MNLVCLSNALCNETPLPIKFRQYPVRTNVTVLIFTTVFSMSKHVCHREVTTVMGLGEINNLNVIYTDIAGHDRKIDDGDSQFPIVQRQHFT